MPVYRIIYTSEFFSIFKYNQQPKKREFMKFVSFLFFLFVSLFVFGQTNQHHSGELQIGNFYADVLHGITFKYENNQAFLFRIGYIDSSQNYISTYKQHKETLPDHSGQKFGPSAPDYSYNKYGFTTDEGDVVWMENSIGLFFGMRSN
jgi:hypothetical protein